MIRLKAAAAVLGACAIFAQPQPAAETLGSLDYAAILRTWRIKGVMSCPQLCLWVENAFPVGLFEVVRQPYRTDVAEFAPFLRALQRSLPESTASHAASEDGSGSTLQFAEARVYEFVPPIDPGLIARPEGAPLSLCYVSELDRWGWRIPELDWIGRPSAMGVLCEGTAFPLSACAGSWGGYYPRSGFVTRDSEAIAAFLQGLRAGRAAAEPAFRVVLKPYRFEPRTGHYIQMLSPARRSAIRIGQDPLSLLEAGAKDGAYRFAHFALFEACRGCLPARLLEARRP